MPPTKRKSSATPASDRHRTKRRSKHVSGYSDIPSPRLEQLPPVTLLDVLDADRYYPVYDQLCSYMPVPSVLALSATCKQLRNAFQERYSVDHRLLRFVEDPLRLRSELGRHGALISGSFALQFFAQQTWLDSDLDIFVERGAAAEAFDTYLQKEEHYCLEPKHCLIGDFRPEPFVWKVRQNFSFTFVSL